MFALPAFCGAGLVEKNENPFEAVRWQAVLGMNRLCKSFGIE